MVLEARVSPKANKLVWSPDIWNEQEVLVEGLIAAYKVHHMGKGRREGQQKMGSGAQANLGDKPKRQP